MKLVFKTATPSELRRIFHTEQLEQGSDHFSFTLHHCKFRKEGRKQIKRQGKVKTEETAKKEKRKGQNRW